MNNLQFRELDNINSIFKQTAESKNEDRGVVTKFKLKGINRYFDENEALQDYYNETRELYKAHAEIDEEQGRVKTDEKGQIVFKSDEDKEICTKALEELSTKSPKDLGAKFELPYKFDPKELEELLPAFRTASLFKISESILLDDSLDLGEKKTRKFTWNMCMALVNAFYAFPRPDEKGVVPKVVSNTVLPINIFMKAGKNIDIIQDKLKEYQDKHNEIVAEDRGDLKEDEEFKLSEQAVEKLNELVKEVVEIDIYTVTTDDLKELDKDVPDSVIEFLTYMD